MVERARDPIRQICQAREVTIVWRAISQGHTHMLVTSPPQLSPAICRGFCGAPGFVWPVLTRIGRLAEGVRRMFP